MGCIYAFALKSATSLQFYFVAHHTTTKFSTKYILRITVHIRKLKVPWVPLDSGVRKGGGGLNHPLQKKFFGSTGGKNENTYSAYYPTTTADNCFSVAYDASMQPPVLLQCLCKKTRIYNNRNFK